LFNAHYDSRCFLPIHIYEAGSGKPVAIFLRPGKTADGAEVARVLVHTAAYWLMHSLRSLTPKLSLWRDAQFDTIHISLQAAPDRALSPQPTSPDKMRPRCHPGARPSSPSDGTCQRL